MTGGPRTGAALSDCAHDTGSVIDAPPPDRRPPITVEQEDGTRDGRPTPMTALTWTYTGYLDSVAPKRGFAGLFSVIAWSACRGASETRSAPISGGTAPMPQMRTSPAFTLHTGPR
nr:hypothetical protein GCM10010200_007040 [Actinomadura rugatobispora]